MRRLPSEFSARTRNVAAILLAATGIAISQDSGKNTLLVRDTGPLSPEEELEKLHVPEGFEIQLFAAEPMINKPINIGFDEKGRAWVSSTVEYPYAAARDRWEDEQGSRVRDSRDAIRILEDTDGDGRADKVTDFADGLDIPTGVLPWHRPEHEAGCIAWSIPNIWYFADTSGDGRADHREVLFGPLGYERDTHGMCSSFRLGPDGWVYATHGFNNTSRLEARDGSSLELHSGNVFRFRPDGSRVEIWSWGQVNPFGLAFDRRGNLYSADCHSSPVYQLIRGAHYPSFGKPHDGLGFGPVMIQHTHGSTGICGIAWIDQGIWGEEWDDHVVIGNPVNSRVNLDRVHFEGSSPRAEERPDFVTSDDPWFRPVDLRIGPDNALYIADFYNRIIGHYEVPLDHPGRDRERGRIWRVVKKDAPAGRERVVEKPEIGDDLEDALAALRGEDPFLRRAAAERLQAAALQGNGAMANAESVAALSRALVEAPTSDDHLVHTLRVALRDQLAAATNGFSAVAGSAIPAARSIAFAVPTPEASEFLLRLLEDESNPGGSGEEWSTSLAHIARHGNPDTFARAIALVRRRHTGKPLVQARALRALEEGRSESGAPPSPTLLAWAAELFAAIRPTPGNAESDHWEVEPVSGSEIPEWSLRPRHDAKGGEVTVLQSMAKGGRDEESRRGVLRSAAFEVPDVLSLEICGHRGHPDQPPHDRNLVRLVEEDSGRVIASAFPPRSDVLAPVRWELPGAVRGSRVRLEIVDRDAGPSYAWLGIARIEPPVADVNSFDGERLRDRALRNLAAILQHTAPAALREQLAPWLPPRPAPPPLPVSPEQRRRLDELIGSRTKAFAAAIDGGHDFDPARGRAMFAAHCATCHRVAGEGGLIGPQLDGIGSRGPARLAEDILDPNRNVDAHFFLRMLTLKDGGTVSGFLKEEAGQVLVLLDAAGQEHRVSKRDVSKDETLAMSLMPPAFGETIPGADFLELLAWLLEK